MESLSNDWGWIQEYRQGPTLKRLVTHIRACPAFSAAILVGSFAARAADALSDLDLILVAQDGKFEAAWAERHALHVTGALAAWDERPDGSSAHSAAHKWITNDVIYIECLIATPASGVRLAEPFAVLTGEPGVAKQIRRRAPISRTEMKATHPIDEAYAAFVAAVRKERA